MRHGILICIILYCIHTFRWIRDYDDRGDNAQTRPSDPRITIAVTRTQRMVGNGPHKSRAHTLR